MGRSRFGVATALARVRRLWSGHQLVADSVGGQDVARVVVVGFQFLAKAHDEVIDGSRRRQGRVAQRLGKQLVTSHDVAHARRETAQHFELPEREPYALAFSPNHLPLQIDFHGASTKMSRDRETFRLPTRETPSSRLQDHRFPLMQGHERPIQYP